ncbi:MAG: SDR family NAD(P)-dependent oxidoreductase [Cyclobacteriaceae bacterium]
MNYTLITGASQGIGRALAFRFARDGNNLILLARSEDSLQTLARELTEKHHIRVEIMVKDLLAPDAAYDVFRQCQKNDWLVRILVNNAGMAHWGEFENLSLEHLQESMLLNQQVMVSLCHYFIPQMKGLPYAHILNVSSTAAFQPTPYFSVYAASKCFVLSFSRSLRQELKRYKINVSCLCPGPTKTPFYSTAGFSAMEKNSGAMMPADEVADIALEGMLRKQGLIIPGFSNRLGRWMSKLLPASWMSALLGNYFKPA